MAASGEHFRQSRLTGRAAVLATVLLATAVSAQTDEEPPVLDAPASGEEARESGVGAGADSSTGTVVSGTVASSGPSLSTARWVGFTPVIVAGATAGEGAWVAGPFAETGATGWVSDTVSGLTVRVTLVWRESAEGRLAELSAGAGDRLGLLPGAVANVAIYVAQ